MKQLQTANEKIQQICDALRRETLEPVREEAGQLLERTEAECRRRLHDAQVEAERMIAEARAQINKERQMAQAQLQQAVRQAVSVLRQAIEEQLLREGLMEQLNAPLKDPEVITRLIQALISGLERAGLATDLEVLVGQTVQPRDINQKLGQALVEKLRGKTVAIGPFEGGVQVKLHQQQLRVDVTDKALSGLLADFLRKDFREMLFQ